MPDVAGLLDTSVVIQLARIDPARLPERISLVGNGLPLYTCDPGDFHQLDGLRVVAVTS